ncbi:tetratricopeptide repeat protein 28-like [Stylophora pistillata]|uniref:tetratricopeptide repeat protein 28-like n=1 Tax=Stylophora pistillata TaxID=50429 RepID=UPI000C051311|nr:tetratricopeptide repeat protein 28-like [Stylophora pistillata]
MTTEEGIWSNKKEYVMTNTCEILQKIRIGLDVATYLLNTDRGIQAAHLCYECLVLLNNLCFDMNGLDVSQVIFNAYYAISDYTNAVQYTKKLIAMFHNTIKSMTELGDKYRRQSRIAEAKELFEGALAIAKSIDYRIGEAVTYGRLGFVFQSLGEYQKAKENHENAVAIATEIGDREGEGRTYGNLGNVFQTLGEHQKAKEYHKKALAIAIEIGNREKEGACYTNLGGVFLSLRKNKQAKEHFDKALAISIEIGDRASEGYCYGSLASLYDSFHDYQKATELLEKVLVISINIGDRKQQGNTYLNLGRVSLSLGKYYESEKYFEKAHLMSSEIGDNMTDFKSLLGITQLKISESKLEEAVMYLCQSIEIYENLRSFLKENDEFKTCLLEEHGNSPYELLSCMLCATGSVGDSLNVEELRRARGLAELMADKLSIESHISADSTSRPRIESIVNQESDCAVLYISYCERHVRLWVLKANGDIDYRVSPEMKFDTLMAAVVCDVEEIFKKSASSFGILHHENCEDRSLGDGIVMSPQEESRATLQGDVTKRNEMILQFCYDQLIAPVKDLLTEPEVIIVPEKCSYRVPFAALRDETVGKYFSETYRIRIVPSLTTLGIIQECPGNYHSQTGALVVGDPWADEVHYKGSTWKWKPLFCARKEAEMVGRLLGVEPLLGEHATKQAVLHALHSVSLIHLAAHGNTERGEIVLSPNCTTKSIPQEEDYLLTMSDISKVKLRAKLVVLSFCHSGRGTFKREGVIGVARAFLASGARSVLVASEDKATELLMKLFYKHLAAGESASESLHQAIKWLRGNGFTEPAQWAPFVLMGDNVTFDLKKIRQKELTEEENDEDKKQGSD